MSQINLTSAQPGRPNVTQVGVVILNWNGLDNTLRCLKSLLDLPQLPGEVLVIDNGSEPAQDQELQQSSRSPIRVLRIDQNLGFAGGCNLGISELLKRPEIQYVLLLNNDTVVEGATIPALLSAMQQPGVGLVGARMVQMDDPNKIENRGLGLSSWGLAWNITDEGGVPSLASGGCLLLSRKMVSELGHSVGSGSSDIQVFDPKLFLYAEDVDLGLRALAHGWKSVTTDQTKVKHIGSASTRQRQDMALYFWHRNILWVMWKNFPLVTLFWNCIPVLLLHVGIMLIYIPKGHGKTILKAKWDAVKGLPRILKERKNMKYSLKYKDFRAILYSNLKAIQAWRKNSA